MGEVSLETLSWRYLRGKKMQAVAICRILFFQSIATKLNKDCIFCCSGKQNVYKQGKLSCLFFFFYRTQVLIRMGYLYFLLLCMFTKEQKHTFKAKTKISAHLIIDLGWYNQQGCHYWQLLGWLLCLQRQLSWLGPSHLPRCYVCIHSTAFGCLVGREMMGVLKLEQLGKKHARLVFLDYP